MTKLQTVTKTSSTPHTCTCTVHCTSINNKVYTRTGVLGILSLCFLQNGSDSYFASILRFRFLFSQRLPAHALVRLLEIPGRVGRHAVLAVFTDCTVTGSSSEQHRTPPTLLFIVDGSWTAGGGRAMAWGLSHDGNGAKGGSTLGGLLPMGARSATAGGPGAVPPTCERCGDSIPLCRCFKGDVTIGLRFEMHVLALTTLCHTFARALLGERRPGDFFVCEPARSRRRCVDSSYRCRQSSSLLCTMRLTETLEVIAFM